MTRRCVIVLLGFLAAQSATSTSQTIPLADYQNDPRLLKVQQFLRDYDSPAEVFAEDFLLAADRHGLDWRLLPSLSVVESGGGKNFKNNNILGWDSCEQEFPSVRAGIHHVASRLSESQLYRNKSLNGKLATYNPNRDYPGRVQRLMARLADDSVSPAPTP